MSATDCHKVNKVHKVEGDSLIAPPDVTTRPTSNHSSPLRLIQPRNRHLLPGLGNYQNGIVWLNPPG